MLATGVSAFHFNISKDTKNVEISIEAFSQLAFLNLQVRLPDSFAPTIRRDDNLSGLEMRNDSIILTQRDRVELFGKADGAFTFVVH